MYLIDEATASDIDFVRASWRQSYRNSPGTHDWPEVAYDVWFTQHMGSVLPRTRITVARPHDWPEGILGWVASEQTDTGYRLFWAFTKSPFRRSGILTALIDAQRPKGEMVYSAKTFHSAGPNVAKHFGFRFIPEVSTRR